MAGYWAMVLSLSSEDDHVEAIEFCDIACTVALGRRFDRKRKSNDPKEATNRFANMTAQERRNALMAAKGWAKAIAGDDRTRYYIELQSALLHIKSGLPVSSGTSAEESQPNKMIMAVKSPEGITLYGPSVSGKEVADAVLANLAPRSVRNVNMLPRDSRRRLRMVRAGLPTGDIWTRTRTP